MSVSATYRALTSLEPTIAYRCWNINDGELYAPVRDDRWAPNQVIDAECYRNGINCDRVYCECGLYAIDDAYTGPYPKFYFDLASGHITRDDCGHIIGAVLMFKTSRKRSGFFTGRHAVIASLRAPVDLSKCDQSTAEAVATTYGVPLVDSHDALVAAARNHPLMVAWHKQQTVQAY